MAIVNGIRYAVYDSVDGPTDDGGTDQGIRVGTARFAAGVHTTFNIYSAVDRRLDGNLMNGRCG